MFTNRQKLCQIWSGTTHRGLSDAGSESETMRNIAVGVIGIGYLGKFHAEKYARMPDVDLVGIVDRNEERANSVAGRLNTTPFSSYKEIIGKVDAVSVVTQTPFHFDISRDFLRNGVDVLIEKPITTTLKEANALIELADSHGLIIQVGHLERFNPVVIALKNIVTNPMFIESHRLNVFQERGTDVDVVLDLMIHDIDIILHFVKSDIGRIDAVGISVVSPNIDIANARITFENGCVANVTASRISMKSMRRMRLFQKNAYVSLDYAKRDITVVKPDGGDSRDLIPGMGMTQMSFPHADPLYAELRSFIECVSKRSAPAVSGRDGEKALRVALSVIDQIKTKKWKGQALT